MILLLLLLCISRKKHFRFRHSGNQTVKKNKLFYKLHTSQNSVDL